MTTDNDLIEAEMAKEPKEGDVEVITITGVFGAGPLLVSMGGTADALVCEFELSHKAAELLGLLLVKASEEAARAGVSRISLDGGETWIVTSGNDTPEGT